MSHAPQMPDPSQGWQSATADIPFMQIVGPIYHRFLGDVAEEGVEYGFFPKAEVHGNKYGRLHGGMISAFADYALGHTIWMARGGLMPNVTVHLGIDYIAAGDPDVWTTCRALITRKTHGMAFMRGEIYAADRLLAIASGVWKAVKPAPLQKEGA